MLKEYKLHVIKRSLFLTLASVYMAGCSGRMTQINDDIDNTYELQAIKTNLKLPTNVVDDDTARYEKTLFATSNMNDQTWRANYATMKMYEIDQQYDNYWQRIDWSDTAISFGGDIASLGLTTAATAIPVAQTTKVLSAAATAVNGSKTAYKQEFLLQQTKEIIKTQADKNRLSVQQTIMARLNCKAAQYPFGMLLSDIHSYASAGSFESALESISQSVKSAQPNANASNTTAVPSTSSSTGNNTGKKVSVPGGGTVTVSYTPASTCPLGSQSAGGASKGAVAGKSKTASKG